MLNLFAPTPLIESDFNKRSIVILGLWRNRKALLINKIKHFMSK